MRKSTFIFLILAATILVSFSRQSNMKTLNATLYSLKYPDTWECVKDTGAIDYYIYPPEDKDPSFNENIVVRHTDMAGNKTTLAEFNTLSKQGIKQLFPDVVYVEDKDIPAKTGTYHTLVYTGTYAGKKMKVKQVFKLQYGFSYILIYTALASTYDKNIKEAGLIMESIKPKPPKK